MLSLQYTKIFRYRKLNYSNFSVPSAFFSNASKYDVEKFKPGSQISGFEVQDIQEIPELQLTAIKLEHLKTNASYLHIARDDSNNVFSIGFKTTPIDSTGVSHILEHNVLCGSSKYPCRDPFFKMLNRSLSTFMNAMTGSDYTVYPFSTQNAIDYRNLMSIYLDAVLKPKLSELDFLQEGWRLEHENLLDDNSKIIFKGVVFNEMKGVFADPQQYFMQKILNGILPSHTYGYVSGGNPLHIPELKWENLKKFHKTHYHPSNTRLFSYGDLTLQDHLSFINDEYLSKFDKRISNTEVPIEPRWSEPRKDNIVGPIDPMVPADSQTSLAVSYLLSDITDEFENFVLYIIGELLVDGPNSPFYRALLETSLGKNFSPVTGFNNHTRTTTFTIGIQGINCSTDEIEKAVDATFDSIIKEGFAEDRIESILHSIEISLKHQTSNFGLNLALNLTPLWNHNGDIIEALKINSKINKFREIMKNNPLFLNKKVDKYFKANQHKYTLIMSPESGFEEKLIAEEQKLLEEKTKNLSKKDVESIWKRAHILKSEQDMKEDISCLPTLEISDISRTTPDVPIQQINIGNGFPLQICLQPTNGVTYFNAILSTKHLSKDLIGLVPLFSSILTLMGAGNLDFRSLSQQIELVSGGFSSNFHLTEHPSNPNIYEEGILLSSYCLQKNFVPMLNLWAKILNEISMNDISRFITLVNMITSEKSNSLVPNGHIYAMTYASSSMNYVSHLKEDLEGITYLKYLQNLCNSEFEDVLNKLKLLAQEILNKKNLRIAINTSVSHSNLDIQNINKFLENIQDNHSYEDPLTHVPSNFTAYSQKVHHSFPFPVNYSSKSYSAVSYSHSDSGPLRILARLMFQFLHREIREKGGAYGGGAKFVPGSPFTFYSYRDPRNIQTIESFDKAVDWVLSGDFTLQDINESKLGVFQNIDSPIPPGFRGLRNFLHYVSDDDFRSHRLSILDTKPEDVTRVCKRYLKEAPLQSTCLIGPPDDSLSNNPEWKTFSNT